MNPLLRTAHRRLAALLVATAALAGCGSQSSEPQPKPAQLDARFEPRILVDGTKLFTYSVQLPRRTPQAGRNRRPDEAPIHQWANHLLLQNGYCRDGFVTLDHYQAGHRAVLRGECREAATAADTNAIDAANRSR